MQTRSDTKDETRRNYSSSAFNPVPSSAYPSDFFAAPPIGCSGYMYGRQFMSQPYSLPPSFGGFSMHDSSILPYGMGQTPSEIVHLQDQKLQLQREIAELTRQRDQLLEGNRILINELPALPGVNQSSGFSTAQPFVRQKTKSFDEVVLEALIVDTAEPLSTIRGRIDPSENRVEYYKQFLPFLLAEIREEVRKQEATIQKENSQPFAVTYRPNNRPNGENSDALTRFRVTLKQKDLPKLEHGFFKELIKIIFSDESPKPSRFSSKAKPPEFCIYAIASVRSHAENDDESNDKEADKMIDLEITLSKKDLEIIEQKRASLFRIHWLAGIIPTERMYLACLHMPRPVFENQFLHAQLPEWPVSYSSAASIEAVSALNTSQSACVMRLASAAEGLYLLQGPPGTGKTTTAAALIVQLAKQYPEKSLLVCTPSNQSLRELLRRVHALAPKIFMALIGVGKELPEAFNEIYVHKFTKTLYHPLILLKRKLKDKGAEILTAATTNEVEAACREVLEKISALLDQTSYFEPKHQTRNALLTLRRALDAKNRLTFSSAINFISSLIEHLEEYITEIQKTSYAFEEYLTQRAQIVFATLVASGRPWLRKQRDNFDMLVVDEAAQALIPAVIIPHTFNPRLCIHIGDPQQLAPTITLPEAQTKGYADSMMYKLMIDYQQPHEMLCLQYRMHGEICHWISQQFYENRLETDASVSARASILMTNTRLHAQLKRPNLFFNISSGREQRFGDEMSASIRNDIEANVIVKLACYLLFTCQFEPKDIGIITFYAAQVALIKDIFGKALGSGYGKSREQIKDLQKKLLIHTVDGFQGGERKITLVSVVRTSESVGFLNDLRRLNVGMSRAQDARWIFGNFEPLNQSNSVLPSLLKELAEKGLIIEEEHVKRINHSHRPK